MSKKMLTVAAVALLLVPAAASAQNEVTATATVANYSSLTGAGNIAFGTISRTADNVVNAAGGVGSATRTLEFNHNVAVSFTGLPANLTATVNAQTVNLPVSIECASRIGAAAWSTPAACATYNLDVGTALTTATLGFGGTITQAAAANAPAATYTGSFNIVITAR